MANTVIMSISVSACDGVVLKGGVIFEAEAEVDAFVAVAPTFDDDVLVEAGAGFE